jgi:imidazole glycerol-phosphate synthase subunit HisH
MNPQQKIAIVDYDAGNLTSVVNAFEFVGATASVVTEPADLVSFDKFVIPGVGAFEPGMQHLQERNLEKALGEQVLGEKKPALCICLGMQLLATRSSEHGDHMGLNWIPGRVEKIDRTEMGLRVPHIGWNEVTFRGQEPCLAHLEDNADFYFANSYHFIPDDKSVIVGTYEYGSELVGIMRKDNIFAAQFHPEKSHHVGLGVIKNFADC